MNAIIVSVDYAPLLAVTLPRNRHHFGRVMVVTSPADSDSQRVAEDNGADVLVTDAFYAGGADFNKWVALEQGLDALGRDGWLCIMDADVVLPQQIPGDYQIGNLYGPYRRMQQDEHAPVTPESGWRTLPRQRDREFAGYTQIFHGDDAHLPDPPWHEIDWRHAGGADSAFQALWPESHKIRPRWDVLHLGNAGVNWCGVGRLAVLQQYMRSRRDHPDYSMERL